jgi:molybdopterin-containing oxidoreductase family membrane subunit
MYSTYLVLMLGNLNLKADMALVGAKSFWNTHLMPVFFGSISVFSACGAVIFTTWLASLIHNEKLKEEIKVSLRFLGKLALMSLITASIFEVSKIYYGVTKLTDNPEAMGLLLKGKFAVNFWLSEVALAFVISFILLITPIKKHISLLAACGAIYTIGIFTLLYNLVIVGQLIPHFHEYNLTGVPKIYSYAPSLHEIMIFAGGIFFFITLFLLGERFLKGNKILVGNP